MEVAVETNTAEAELDGEKESLENMSAKMTSTSKTNMRMEYLEDYPT